MNVSGCTYLRKIRCPVCGEDAWVRTADDRRRLNNLVWSWHGDPFCRNSDMGIERYKLNELFLLMFEELESE